MCSSSATSLIVRNAFGAFSRARGAARLVRQQVTGLAHSSSLTQEWRSVHVRLQHLARPEGEDPARQDGHLDAGLRVASDPAAPFCRTEKVPKPLILTNSPASSAWHMRSSTVSSSSAESFRDRADLGVDRLRQLRARHGVHPRTLGMRSRSSSN